MVLTSQNIPYGANLYYQSGQEVESGELICEWDPYNAVILTDVTGKVVFNNMIEGTTYRTDSDEQTGYYEKVIVETKDKTRNPSISIFDENGEEVGFMTCRLVLILWLAKAKTLSGIHYCKNTQGRW
jgi:DNA-directed RNA polymerase subunit beta'